MIITSTARIHDRILVKISANAQYGYVFHTFSAYLEYGSWVDEYVGRPKVSVNYVQFSEAS